MVAALRSGLCIIFLWLVADFEKRLEEEGAVTKSLRGAGRTETGPQWTKVIFDRGGPDASIVATLQYINTLFGKV